MTFDDVLLASSGALVVFLGGIELGRRFGRNGERARCLGLVWQSIEVLGDGFTPGCEHGRIYRSILSERATLMSKDELLGKEASGG